MTTTELPTFPMTPAVYLATEWPTDEPDENGRLSFAVECKNGTCGLVHEVRVARADFEAWRAGEYIHVAMSYLSAAERELLISLTCGPCFDEMFKDFD